MSKKYLAQGKLLRGPVEMEKPDENEYYQFDGAGIKWFNKGVYNSDLNHYNNHIASLPSIKADWLTDSDDGRLMTLDVDFKIKRGNQKITIPDQQQWQEMDVNEKDQYFEKVAVKIESTDEIEDEIRMIISHAFLGEDQNISKESFDLAISECAKYFRKLIAVPINQDREVKKGDRDLYNKNLMRTYPPYSGKIIGAGKSPSIQEQIEELQKHLPNQDKQQEVGYSSSQAGLKWVKAKEQLPEKSGEANKVIVVGDHPSLSFVAWGFKNFADSPEIYVNIGPKSFLCVSGDANFHSTYPIENVKWLDESASNKQATPVDGYWKERCEAAEKCMLTKDIPKNRSSTDNYQYMQWIEAYAAWQKISSTPPQSKE